MLGHSESIGESWAARLSDLAAFCVGVPAPTHAATCHMGVLLPRPARGRENGAAATVLTCIGNSVGLES